MRNKRALSTNIAFQCCIFHCRILILRTLGADIPDGLQRLHRDCQQREKNEKNEKNLPKVTNVKKFSYDQSRVPWDSCSFCTASGVLYIHEIDFHRKTLHLQHPSSFSPFFLLSTQPLRSFP